MGEEQAVVPKRHPAPSWFRRQHGARPDDGVLADDAARTDLRGGVDPAPTARPRRSGAIPGGKPCRGMKERQDPGDRHAGVGHPDEHLSDAAKSRARPRIAEAPLRFAAAK